MQNLFTSTCAALSSAKGKAGVSLIRVSGLDAVEIASKVFKPLKKELSEVESNKAIFGKMYSHGDCFDNGIATVFRSPNSFTGEDTVEICCHGSELGVSLLLSALFESGAVPAEPGEFTKRAFINGKIDLTQAEATAMLIEATSVEALRLSEAQTRGVVGEKVNEISADILEILSNVYAYIDYPDEDIADISQEEMRSRTSSIRNDISALIATYDVGKAITHGVECAIIGAPNAGKSSLLNLLCDSDRAIVTDIPGTTRDVVTERVKIDNITLNISDTAGIRESDDLIEKIGIERTYASAEKCELVILVLDASKPFALKDKSMIDYVKTLDNKNKIIVLNKIDLSESFLQEYKSYANSLNLNYIVKMSAKHGDGRIQFCDALKALYPIGDDEIRGGLVITSARQLASLQKALNCIEDSLTALETLTPDMACAELENALSALREADGRAVNEEIINEIFSHFCVGK